MRYALVLLALLTPVLAHAQEAVPTCPCSVTLTNKELQALGSFIDIAVRSRGLEVAETGVVLIKKLQAAKPVDPKEVSK